MKQRKIFKIILDVVPCWNKIILGRSTDGGGSGQKFFKIFYFDMEPRPYVTHGDFEKRAFIALNTAVWSFVLRLDIRQYTSGTCLTHVFALTKQCMDNSCLNWLPTTAKVPSMYHDFAMDSKRRHAGE